mgnify:CR=1 FL=1
MRKSRFKTVTWVIVVALIAVAGLQVFSLSRMYSDVNRRFAQTVSSAMERSAYEELVTRPNPAVSRQPFISPDDVESVTVKDEGGVSKIEVKKKRENDRPKAKTTKLAAEKDKEVRVSHSETRVVRRDSIPDAGDSRVLSSYSDTTFYFNDTLALKGKPLNDTLGMPMGGLIINAKLDIDSVIYDSHGIVPQVGVSSSGSSNVTIYVISDSKGGVQTYGFTSSFYAGESLNPEQFHRYDSLLTQNLLRAGIYTPHKASVLEKESGDILYTQGEDVINPIRFETPLGADGATVCRVELPNPNRGFLGEMGWIIASSAIILILLCFAFVYLLRTMFRQKSVEEMRIDFTHNITHELKTPIAVAYAANDAMLNFSADSDPARREKYLKIVETQLDNLSEMVEKILSMSVGEESNLKLRYSEVALGPLMERILADYEMKGDKPITAKLDIEPAGLTVNADKFHLANILGNLVDNAVKYSGDRVEISVSAMKKDGFTEITVSDDGMGIPASALGRIFDKFYRVPTGNMHNVKGFGLGLYYARMVVEGQGGTISVKSREGRGTIFTIKLPDDGK